MAAIGSLLGNWIEMLEAATKLWRLDCKLRFLFFGVIALGGVLLMVACGSSAPGDIVSTSDFATEVPPDFARVGGITTTLPPSVPIRNIGGEVGDLAPEFGGIRAWINGGPYTMEQLRGQVVLIDFWTYTCINCIRTYPFLRQWHLRYADDGLVIIGVHAPEFEFEKDYDNVSEAVRSNVLEWVMAQDNDFVTWRRYDLSLINI